MRLLSFLVKRFISMAITALVILLVSYTLIFFAPGGIYQISQRFFDNSNQPLASIFFQMFYHSYVLPMMSLQFVSQSYALQRAILNSMVLTFGSIVVAALIGVPLGVLSAMKRNTWVDYLGSLVSTLQGVSTMVIGIVLIMVFGLFFPIFPVNGWGSPNEAVLPIFTLATANIGFIIKYVRSGMLETMRKEYIDTARAKGVPNLRIVFVHAIRPALVAVITVFGPQAAWTVMNTTIVENIFSIPGLGRMLGNAFQAGSMMNSSFSPFAAMESIFLFSVFVLILNLIVDLLYYWMDPRHPNRLTKAGALI